MTYRIVKRAYSQYEAVADGFTTYIAADLEAMKIQAEKQDGEYLVRSETQQDSIPGNNPADQGGIAWV